MSDYTVTHILIAVRSCLFLVVNSWTEISITSYIIYSIANQIHTLCNKSFTVELRRMWVSIAWHCGQRSRYTGWPYIWSLLFSVHLNCKFADKISTKISWNCSPDIIHFENGNLIYHMMQIQKICNIFLNIYQVYISRLNIWSLSVHVPVTTIRTC